MDPFINACIESLSDHPIDFTLEIQWSKGIVWVSITPEGGCAQRGAFYYNRFGQWVNVIDWMDM